MKKLKLISDLLRRKKAKAPPSESIGLHLVHVAYDEPGITIHEMVDTKAIKVMMDEGDEECAAIVKAVSTDKQYDGLIDGVSPLEVKLTATRKRIAEKAAAIVTAAQVPLINLYEVLESEINAKTMDERIDAYLDANPEIEENEGLAETEALASQAENRWTEAKQEAERIKGSKNAPEPWFIHNPWFYTGMLVIGFAVESVLSFFAISAMESNDLPAPFVWGIVISIGFFLALGSHFLGRAVAFKEAGLKLYAPMALVCLPLFIVLFVRVGDDNSLMVLALINVVVNLLAVFWSYLKHEDEPQFRYANAAKHWQLEKARLDTKVTGSKKRVRSIAKSAIDAELKPINSQVEGIKTAIGLLDSYLLNDVVTSLTTSHEHDIQILRFNIIKARAANGYPPVSFNGVPIPKLNVLQSPSGAPPESDNSTLAPIPAVPTKPTPELSNGHTVLGALLILLSFFGFGCGTDNLAPISKAVMVVQDNTTASTDTINTYTAQEQVQFALSAIDFDPVDDPMDVTLDEVQFFAIAIDDRKFKIFYDAAPLEMGDTSIMRVDAKRRKAQRRFVEGAIKTLDMIPRPREGLPHSRVLMCLCEGFTKLVEFSGDETTAIIFSDMIEHREDFSFYAYKRKNLMEDYSAIAARFDRECPSMKDLTGLDRVVIVSYPHPDLDGLGVAVKDFWERYLNDRGTHVTWQPRINRIAGDIAAH